jgi:hypothetical protein
MSDIYAYTNKNGNIHFSTDISSFWHKGLQEYAISGLKSLQHQLRREILKGFFNEMLKQKLVLLAWKTNDNCEVFWFYEWKSYTQGPIPGPLL